MRQVFSLLASFAVMDVALTVHISLSMASLYHLANSGAVFVRSCVLVFEVMTTFASGQVPMAHLSMNATRADLPIPWPLAMAILNGT